MKVTMAEVRAFIVPMAKVLNYFPMNPGIWGTGLNNPQAHCGI